MVLLTKLKDKEAIGWCWGIGEAIAVPLTRLRILSVCVEGSLGQNGLFGGFMMEREDLMNESSGDVQTAETDMAVAHEQCKS